MKVIQGGGVKIQTPYEAVRAVLDDGRYDAVRMVAGSGAAISSGAASGAGVNTSETA